MGKILLVVVLFAAVVYAGFWLLERRRRGRPARPTRSRPQLQPRARSKAPDDDEDFLRELERRRRRAARDRGQQMPGKDDDEPKDGPSES